MAHYTENTYTIPEDRRDELEEIIGALWDDGIFVRGEKSDGTLTIMTTDHNQRLRAKAIILGRSDDSDDSDDDSSTEEVVITPEDVGTLDDVIEDDEE